LKVMHTWASILVYVSLYLIWLTDCNIILYFMMVTGAKYIGAFLKENYTLKVLNMGDNPISDVGISQIADGMQTNTSLTELNVARCGLSAKGTTCNSCNTGESCLPDMYTLILGPHVYLSDKAQPNGLEITCFTSLLK